MTGRPESAPPRSTWTGRLVARALAAASWLAGRLPFGPAVRAAEIGGELWYRLAPGRRALARRNLQRVATWLVADASAGDSVRSTEARPLDPGIVAAANDPAALERLVRAAFRHYARYYLELLRIPSLRPAVVRDIEVEDPELVARVLGAPGPLLFASLHFGAIELPAVYFAVHDTRPVSAPMETLANPDLQAFFVRSRGSLGVRIVDPREARRELSAALGRGEAVGLVADRDVLGSGVEVPFFGRPARFPIGASLLAIESGLPLWVVAVRRISRSRYRARVVRVDLPPDGPRRERVTAHLAALARAYEALVADAPAQWWSAFFPIWPDLEERAASSGGTPA